MSPATLNPAFERSASAAGATPIADVVLVGAGIMSATLAALLHELEPSWTIEVIERLEQVAEESSDAWNNAGTGHAALCELNYTPERPDGSIEVNKAIKINESFEVSKQFWSFLVRTGRIKSPGSFINRVPHISFVWGTENVSYLRKRFEALTAHTLFQGMEFSSDPAQLREWMPLVMEGRDAAVPVAATRYLRGTDVDFGALTRVLLRELSGDLESDRQVGRQSGLNLGEEVTALRRSDERGPWELTLRSIKTGATRTRSARFIFLGAGGRALTLLQHSGIPEGKGFGGFPVSGQWLRCTNPAVIARHGAKVYGKAAIGAPPMSVPHLDSRFIGGEKALLFGPYAGFSTKFLKQGSLLDLPLSLRPDNLIPMLAAGATNLGLTQYLIGQVLQSPEDRLNALKDYLPAAQMEDWRLESAGQRVQIIKHDAKVGGVLQFGTEVICAKDGSIAALLGASPGASTSVPIMLDLISACFPEQMRHGAWPDKLRAMIPSFGQSLDRDATLFARVQADNNEALGLV